jgi:uncharacterized membrane protein (DUF485 family)
MGGARLTGSTLFYCFLLLPSFFANNCLYFCFLLLVMGFATAFCYTLPLGFVVAFCYLLRIGRMLAEWVYVPCALPVAESVHTTQEPV